MLNVLAMQENLLKMKGKAVSETDQKVSQAITKGMDDRKDKEAREEEAKNQAAANLGQGEGHGQGQGQGQGQG